MRVPNAAQRGNLEFNMTPMIDVTFQLIIFFLLANRFSQQGAEVEKNVPLAENVLDEEGDPANRLIVNVADDGSLMLGASPITQGGLLAELKKAEPSVEIRLRCNAPMPYGKVRPLLNACFDGGFGNVTFAVKEPKP